MSNLEFEILPSILAADFSELGPEAQRVERSGIKTIHLDLMSYPFVPNLSFGPALAKMLLKYTNLRQHTHLMVDDPENHIDDYVNNNTDIIIVHAEGCKPLYRTLMYLKDKGVRAGVAFRPGTNYTIVPFSILDKVVDEVLFMTVEPGYGGQKFIPEVLDTIRRFKKEHPHVSVSADGGLGAFEKDGTPILDTETTLYQATESGVDRAVIGTSLFIQRYRDENYSPLITESQRVGEIGYRIFMARMQKEMGRSP